MVLAAALAPGLPTRAEPVQADAAQVAPVRAGSVPAGTGQAGREADDLPSTGVYRLAPADLVQWVAVRNAQALSAALQTQVAERLLDSERALYAPVLFSSARRENVDRPRNQDDPLQSPFFGEQQDLKEKISTLAVGARTLLPTGAEGSLSYQWLERRSNALGNTQEYVGTATVSLRQPLMRNRGRAATEADLRVVELEREIDVLRYRASLLEASGDALNAYWQLHRALEGLEIRRASLDTVEQLFEDVERRVRGGFAPSTDLLEARIANTSRRADLTRAERLVAEAQSQLRTILNLAPAGPAALAFEPTASPRLAVDRSVPLEVRIQAARERWPDLLIAMLRERQERVRLGLAENQRMAALDVEVGFNWNSIGVDDGNGYDGMYSIWNASRLSHAQGWYAGVEFEVPLGNREAAGRADAQGFRLQQARLEAVSVGNALGQDIAMRWQQLGSALTEAQELGRDAELRAQLLEAERAQYSLGQARLSEVFDRVEELNESRQRLVDARTRLELARLALLIADGSLLDAYGLRVELTP